MTVNDNPSRRSWQTLWHKHPGIHKDLTTGEKMADVIRKWMGSWPFVVGFFLFMFGWIFINSVFLVNRGFDPYPYILLNLALSMLAAIQAAILLIAAKRADSIASEIAIHTEKNTDDLKDLIAENTRLTSEVKANTDLLEDIHKIVKQIGKG